MQWKKTVWHRRYILYPIVSSIVFCRTHYLPLSDKNSSSGVNAKDTILKNHFETCSRNAKHTSVQFQNELITFCWQIVQNLLISSLNESTAFSVLAKNQQIWQAKAAVDRNELWWSSWHCLYLRKFMLALYFPRVINI